MIDVHTHILPAMDDGSRNVEMSLEMLRQEKQQGVDTVVLTPHFYRDKEDPEHYLVRRQKAFETLQEAIRQQENEEYPRLLLGAEVAWVPNLAEWSGLSQLCIGGGQYMLLEMPFYHWSDQTVYQIYDLMEQGITPIFAHLERYLKNQKPEYIQEIISMGSPIQVSCAPLQRFFERKPIVQLLKRRQAHLLGSDCHNLTVRPPNLAQGYAAVEKILGSQTAQMLDDNAHQLFGEL